MGVEGSFDWQAGSKKKNSKAKKARGRRAGGLPTWRSGLHITGSITVVVTDL